MGPEPENPKKSDLQYKGWEEALLEWIEKNPNFLFINELVPTEYDDIHTEANKPKITIQTPQDGQLVSDYINMGVIVESNFKIKEVDFYLNDLFVSSDFYPPYKANINLSNEDFGAHIITDKVYDQYQNSDESLVSIIKSR